MSRSGTRGSFSVHRAVVDVVKITLRSLPMYLRPVVALDPRRFGRRRLILRDRGGAAVQSFSDLADDLKLFATTFFGGFLFMAVYLA